MQSILIALFFLSALAYLGFLAYRSFTAQSCDTGCGSCGSGIDVEKIFKEIKRKDSVLNQ